MNRLAATRLGIEDADDSPVDTAALLQWTADRAAVETFFRLREQERTGLIAWLAETTGGVADVVFAMAATGKIFDAVPFGLAAAALYGPPAHAQAAVPGPVSGTDEGFVARVRAEERYLGGTSSDIGALQAFGQASESLVTRWADNGHSIQAAALCERAEAILAELAGTEDGREALASRSRVLEAGLDARFTALADALSTVLAAPERRAPIRRRSPPRRRHSPRSASTAASGIATPRPRGRRRRARARWSRHPRNQPRHWPKARPG